MLILGIHDGHNASACIVRDGEVLAALAEERLTNRKNQSGVPKLAIEKILEFSKTNPEDIDVVAVSSLLRIGDPLAKRNPILSVLETFPFLFTNSKITLFIVNFMHLFRETGQLKNLLSELKIKAPIKFIDHHTAHAASAYFQRPWPDKTLILTLDGAGDGLCASVSIGKGKRIRRIAQTSFVHSPSNNLYSEVTGFLGLKRWEHEYKLMGLAPYGKPEYLINELRKIIRINPDNPLEFQNLSGRYARRMQPYLSKIFREQRFDNIAAATQNHFEKLVVSWVKNAIKKTTIRKIVCSGGSFLNVKTNQIIRELPEVENVYFDPVCDDVGTSIGAALFIEGRDRAIKNLYLGAEYSEREILKEIQKHRLTKIATLPKDLPKTIAKILVSGKIVARFDERDEFGPRALGNRSILADPRNPGVIRKLNFAIKMRDFWMPFAPTILEEDVSKYLVNAKRAPFMIEAFSIKPKASEIIAGLHPYDLSCRPQTLNRSQNPDYYNIIKVFKILTGVGAVLNTSFNLHGYPIVGTPETAVSTFLNSGLDALAIGPFLLEKNSSRYNT